MNAAFAFEEISKAVDYALTLYSDEEDIKNIKFYYAVYITERQRYIVTEIQNLNEPISNVPRDINNPCEIYVMGTIYHPPPSLEVSPRDYDIRFYTMYNADTNNSFLSLWRKAKHITNKKLYSNIGHVYFVIYKEG